MGQKKPQWNQGASESIRRRLYPQQKSKTAMQMKTRTTITRGEEKRNRRRTDLEEVQRMEYGENKKGTERANRRKGRSDGLCEEAEGVLTIVEHQSEDGGGDLVHCYMFRRSCLARRYLS